MQPLTPLDPMIHGRNVKRADALPEEFYSTRTYTEELIGFIKADLGDGQPFFAYLSYMVPHDPLHAPAEFIAKYADHYVEGWDGLLADRVSAKQQLGMILDAVQIPQNILASAWSDVPVEQQTLFARDMGTYAVMTDYMDRSIGRPFDFLRDVGESDNTVVMFMSDNGPNGAHATAYPDNADGTSKRRSR